MSRKRRKLRKKIPKGYDSVYEYDLHSSCLKGCTIHPKTIEYTIEKRYEVDFMHPKDEKTLIEAKGRFRDSDEAAKYVWFAKCNPEYNLVFVFADPNKPMPRARKRKDGTRFSHSEWATKNGFTHYSPDNVPEEWSK